MDLEDDDSFNEAVFSADLDGIGSVTGSISSSVTVNSDKGNDAAPLASGAAVILKNCIMVNPKQRGNPLLKFIRKVPWEYSEVVPDYVMGTFTCALFLSIRYHNLHPDYIHERLKELRREYALRVLLVQIDVADPYPILRSLTHIALLAELTVMPTNSAEESGRILENYKLYENKPPEMIKEQNDTELMQQVISALTTIRSVNKTDAMTLLKVFGSLNHLLKADLDTISICPGIGPKKAQLVYLSLRENFTL